MSIYLIRHGARFDKAHRKYWREEFGGESLDPPLSALGFQMIAARAKQFKDKGIKRIYTSPWIRCLQTASILSSGAGGIPITIDYRLAERVKGPWFPDGMPQLNPLHANQFPFVTCPEARLDFNKGIKFPESLSGFRGRCEEFVNDHVPENEYDSNDIDNCILVSHGMTQRWLALTLTGHTEPKPGNPKVGQVYEITNDKTVNVWPYIEG